ncbi:alpha/beta fold hydrolase [Streptomyces sp. NPDC101194]|uniref:alpha/beta fold hydrolase n=1 Tax=Streptomyces sp. NPDC101194 TaxID=3366127 RepID=UPI0038056C66
MPAEYCRHVPLAGHVERVLDRLGLTSAVHAVGNSLGGAIAMQLTARAPTRVSSLTLRQVARDLGSWRGVRPDWRTKPLAEVSALDVPVLVAWGAHDRILPARHLIDAASALPGARIHLFPRTGHLPQIERTEETAALLSSFRNDL